MTEQAMTADLPIRHLIILGHPGPVGFSHAVAACYADTVRACGQEAVLRDLYDLDFDPRLKASERDAAGAIPNDVAAELEPLRGSTSIALVYPIWFGMPPAIIKGYVDRVLGHGFAASNLKEASFLPFSGQAPDPVYFLRIDPSWLEEQGQWLGLRQTFDLYLETVFGFSAVRHVHFDAVVEGTKQQYFNECLGQVEEAARALCAELLHERHQARFRKQQTIGN